MKFKNQKENITLFLIGILILTLGVALIIKADLGVGPWDSVNVGLSKILGLSVGGAGFIIAIIMTILAGIFRNGSYNVKTLMTAFVLSGCTNFWLLVVNYISFKENLAERIICFIIGIILLSLGLTLYLISKLSPNSLDDCMVAFKEKFNLSIVKAKVIMDAIGIAIAFFVSGPIGIGTIIITVFVGPLVGLFNGRLSNLIKILNKCNVD